VKGGEAHQKMALWGWIDTVKKTVNSNGLRLSPTERNYQSFHRQLITWQPREVNPLLKYLSIPKITSFLRHVYVFITDLNDNTQSENIISIYKEDLQEFTKEITTDTATVIAATASPNADAGIGKQLTAGITSLFNGEATTSSPSTTSSTDVCVAIWKFLFSSYIYCLRLLMYLYVFNACKLRYLFNFAKFEYSRSKSRREKLLEALQLDPKTYTTDPSEEEEFKTWHANFTLESRTKDISHLLATNPKLRAIHNELRTIQIFLTFPLNIICCSYINNAIQGHKTLPLF
jgi:hypothetical protein